MGTANIVIFNIEDKEYYLTSLDIVNGKMDIGFTEDIDNSLLFPNDTVAAAFMCFVISMHDYEGCSVPKHRIAEVTVIDKE